VPIPVGIAIASAVAIGFLFLLARWALYHPSKYPKGNWDTKQLVGASDAWLETSDGVKIHGWWVGREGSPFATLFLHGNGDNISYYTPYIQESSLLDRRFSSLITAVMARVADGLANKASTGIAKQVSSTCWVKAIGLSRLSSMGSHSEAR
jgi:hypothetical protein